MGLDITAYSGLTEFCPKNESESPGAGQTYFYKNMEFPDQFEGLKERTIYSYAKSFCFWAGSYSLYNLWRGILAYMVHYNDKKGETNPFYELINFSDCEGAIGQVVAKKLAADFAEWQEEADANPDDWFRMKYAEWRKAFEIAADNGAVQFH